MVVIDRHTNLAALIWYVHKQTVSCFCFFVRLLLVQVVLTVNNFHCVNDVLIEHFCCPDVNDVPIEHFRCPDRAFPVSHSCPDNCPDRAFPLSR